MSDLKDVAEVNISRGSARLTKATFGSILVLSQNANLPSTGIVTVSDYQSFTDQVGPDSSINEALDSIVSLAFQQENTVPELKLKKVDPADTNDAGDTPYVVNFKEAINNNVDFYGFMTDINDVMINDTGNSITETNLENLADAAENYKKMFGFSIGDTDITDSTVDTDIFSNLKSLSYDYTWGLFYSKLSYDEDGTTYCRKPEAAWMSRVFAEVPGAAIWKYQILEGFPADELNDSEISALDDKNANYFEKIAGANCTSSRGVVVGGEYIDIVRSIDYMEYSISFAIFKNFLDKKKVPYNQPGIDSTEEKLRTVLQNASEDHYNILTSYEVNMPKYDEIADQDKLDRVLNNTTFSGTLTGAIQFMNIEGKLNV